MAAARLRLPYSPGFVLISAFLAMVGFLLALVVQSQIFGLLFPPPLDAQALWAGLLMPIPLWFLTHQVLLLVTKGLLYPLGVPGRFELDETGVSLREGRQTVTLRWAEITTVRTGEAEALDLDAVPVHDPGALQLAKAGAAVAAKDWTLTFSAADGRSISVSSRGFRRPMRRAEPQIRAWLAEHRAITLEALAQPQQNLQS